MSVQQLKKASLIKRFNAATVVQLQGIPLGEAKQKVIVKSYLQNNYTCFSTNIAFCNY